MALVSYSDLQTQVANWLARSDLTAYIPDMITLFEAAAARKLKVRPQETVVTISTTQGVGTLPSDFLGYRRVKWLGSWPGDLEYVHPTIFDGQSADGVSGSPSIFTIQGSSIKIYPIDDSGIELLYNQKSAALSTALNWLWTNHPDAYLFGTLAEANFFNRGSAITMAAAWLKRRDDVFDEIKLLDANERQGMAMRVLGPTP